MKSSNHGASPLAPFKVSDGILTSSGFYRTDITDAKGEYVCSVILPSYLGQGAGRYHASFIVYMLDSSPGSNMNQNTSTVRIPLIFWSDHEDRDLPTPQATRRDGAHVVIPLYGSETDELLADAEHYAHRDGPGSVGIKSSARATVKAIKNAREGL